MSDTTTPSAAEVMWTSLPCLSADNPGHPVGCRTWTRWDGARSEYGEGPPNEHTPDDMLAFLRERGFHVMVHAWVKWPVHVRIQACDTAEQSSYGGPTLHAALEAAVIAVGELTDADVWCVRCGEVDIDCRCGRRKRLADG